MGIILARCPRRAICTRMLVAEAGPTATPTVVAGTEAQGEGRDLFIAKGCPGCHGQDAEGISIAPALAGHTEQMVSRQVRTPRFRMPAFSERQIEAELEAVAHFIAGLEGEGRMHAEVPPGELALDGLGSAQGRLRGRCHHHVGHIIDVLGKESTGVRRRPYW